MSYILDALNKAERERKRGRAPAVQGSAAPPPDRTPGNPWLWIALLAVVFNALLAGLLVWSSLQEQEAAPATPPPPATTVTEPAPVVAAASPASAAMPAGTPETPDAPPVVAPREAPAAAAPLPDVRPAQPVKPASPLPLMTDAELQQQAREMEIEKQPAAAPVAAPAPEQAVNSLPPLASIPLQIELRPDLRQALPPLRVDVHVYDEVPANRFVMINLRRYREGDEIADDLRLERVTREGMVLRFRGEPFRLLMQY